MTQSLVVGNWKMNTLPSDAMELTSKLEGNASIVAAIKQHVGVVVCPPFTSLHAVRSVITSSKIHLGAQNCGREDSGAFTGEVSAPMLAALGCTYVIVGHSERRRDQFETNEIIGLKARHARAHGLTPIVCIGETLDERQTNQTVEVLRAQLDGIASTAGVETLTESIFAYEPVWAIGTGQSATVAQVQSTHEDIHRHLRLAYGLEIRLLYGGSVTSSNAGELLHLPGVGGALVGGASLKPDQFAAIVAAAVRE